CVVTVANAIRSTVAAAMPITTAFVRCSAGNPAAASPITMALSPARTRSIMMTWKSAARSGESRLGIWPVPLLFGFPLGLSPEMRPKVHGLAASVLARRHKEFHHVLGLAQHSSGEAKTGVEPRQVPQGGM